jgi:hypothetical protein
MDLVNIALFVILVNGFSFDFELRNKKVDVAQQNGWGQADLSSIMKNEQTLTGYLEPWS